MNSEKRIIGMEFDSTKTVNIKEWVDMTSGRADADLRVSVPILQRGLVWSPIQNEMIWDSLLRGFPIGSFIVVKAIQAQLKDAAKDEVKAACSHYHLLDGQQRSHAISLGYQTWEQCCESQGKVASSILWMDLNPDVDQLAKTTRKFAIRVTTPAHPWGYQLNDSCSSITRQEIQKACAGRKSKPAPFAMMPHKADCPIPLSFLLSVQEDDHQKYWEHVADNLPNGATNQWVTKVKELLHSDKLDNQHYLQEIKKGIGLVQKGCVVVIPAPCDLDRENMQESGGNRHEGISNIEQLFQRVNRSGTRLDGEELLYSMIKAYFPEMAQAVDDASFHRMPASRLVSLAVRCALSDHSRLHRSVSVAEIRKIASDADKTGEKEKILQFIQGAGPNHSSYLVGKCDKVTQLLEKGGLFPFLRTSIAVNSPILYLFMMWCYEYGKVTEENEDMVLAFVCAVHWLADKKEAIVQKVFEALSEGETENTEDHVVSAILRGVRKACEEDLLYVPNPCQFDEFLEKWKSALNQVAEQCEHSSIQNHILHESNPIWSGENGKRWNWGLFFWKVLDNREFVYFAQRAYMTTTFEAYDPAQKDMWQAINRPWDLDHLVPASYFYQQQGKYMPALRDWYNRNGNMRAWALEKNRADGDAAFDKKMNDKPEDVRADKPEDVRADSFIDEHVYGLFSKVENKMSLEESDVAQSFILGVMQRMQNMYDDWYDQLKIRLLGVDEYTKKPIG